jgi:His/Glu/Gln/Arg/opine family amino acid ABC transporter permease subunit
MPEIWQDPPTQALLWEGLQVTLWLTGLSAGLATLLSLGLAYLSQQAWGGWWAQRYIDIFRSVPALILLIIFAYGLPNAFPLETRREVFFQSGLMQSLRDLSGLSIPYYALAAGLALALNTSAYLAELLRSGFSTLDPNQLAAARSLGASPWQVFGRLMLPQALMASRPAIISRLVHHQKNTALASFVAVPELFKAGQTAISRSFQAIDLLILLALLYLLLAGLWAGLLRGLLSGPLIGQRGP